MMKLYGSAGAPGAPPGAAGGFPPGGFPGGAPGATGTDESGPTIEEVD